MFDQKSSSDRKDTPGIVREAWRAQLYDELAAKAAQRRRGASVRQAALVGVLIGIAGSVALYMH